MELREVLGLIAGTITTIAFVPQALRIHRTKHTKDLSLTMFLFFSLGIFLWLIYGIWGRSLPLISANAVTLALAIYILIMKIRHG